MRLGFNPRAHAGRDIGGDGDVSDKASFNPRAHAGRDNNEVLKLQRLFVSIHAPTRGATE